MVNFWWMITKKIKKTWFFQDTCSYLRYIKYIYFFCPLLPPTMEACKGPYLSTLLGVHRNSIIKGISLRRLVTFRMITKRCCMPQDYWISDDNPKGQWEHWHGNLMKLNQSKYWCQIHQACSSCMWIDMFLCSHSSMFCICGYLHIYPDILYIPVAINTFISCLYL